MRSFPRGVWIFALALATVTSLPYVVGWLSTPDGWAYSGAAAIPKSATLDYASYLGNMWQGERGHWDYRFSFTHEEHAGIPLIKWVYYGLGHVAGVTGLSLPLIFHVARFVFTACFGLALWVFSGWFFAETSTRWVCMVFATIVSGWSWLLLWLAPGMTGRISPIEFWLGDAFNLFGAFLSLHFVLAIILQIVVILVYERWSREGDRRYLLALTIILPAQSFIQPYLIVLLGSLIGILTLYRVFVTHRIALRRALWLGLPLGVYAGTTLYQLLAMRADPIWSDFVEQNKTLSPPVVYYVLGYLPLLIPAGLGLRRLLRDDHQDDRWLLPLIWIGLVMLLLYAPLPTQRRYLLGVQTPLTLLATYGWVHVVLPAFGPRWRPLVTIVYVQFGAIALLLIVLGNVVALARPHSYDYPFFQPDERTAFRWLEHTARPDEVVFTTQDTEGNGSGSRLVAALGQQVFIGHWIETIDFADKIEQVEKFYDPATPDSWRIQLLSDSHAHFVWYDQYARELGTWNPAEADYLEIGFESGQVTVFRVR
jgi:hypothetical protein